MVLVAAALWVPRLTGPIDLRYDAGVYYTLGTALAEGRGYRLLNEPGEIEAIQYPPLLPLIVAGASMAHRDRRPRRHGASVALDVCGAVRRATRSRSSSSAGVG